MFSSSISFLQKSLLRLAVLVAALLGMEEIMSVFQLQQLQRSMQLTQHNLRKNPVDETADCFRYATMTLTEGVGFGHKFADVVLGMKFAEETNSTYLFDDKSWGNNGLHGSYEWVYDLLPLHKTERTYTDVQVQHGIYPEDQNSKYIVKGHWTELVELSKSSPLCNVIFAARHQLCCNKPNDRRSICWCLEDSNRIGAYEAVKERPREAYTESTHVPQEQLSDFMSSFDDGNNNTRSLASVVWHIRLGDIVLNAGKDYYNAIATQVAEAFRSSNVTAHVFILGEGGKPNIIKSFPFLDIICQDFFSGRCSYLETDAKDTLYHMINCDVLVTSGSSFASVAATLRPRSRGVTLAAMAKEGSIGREVFRVSEQLDIAENGIIAEIGVLREFLQERNTTHSR